ncbi:MAG: YceI family protein [Candidatus Pacebacteria bacterium]|nr:YceI family protein [Candidatus Paceibacterota bacterium]
MKNLGIIILIVLLGVGIWHVSQNDETNEVNSVTTENTTEQVENSNNEDMMIESESSISGTTSYSIQKEYFGQPAETVVGTGSDIDGTVDYENGMLNANLMIATNSLSTGSDGRDDYVVGLIGESIMAEINNAEVNFPLNQEIVVDVTIDGTTNQVPFMLSGNEIESGISLAGSGTITLSSFGIERPGTTGVYTTSDEVILNVDIVSS